MVGQFLMRKQKYNKSHIIGLFHVRVNIGWERCRVYDGTVITQCYKCLGYNHRAAECRNKKVCFKCQRNHKSRDCSKESMNKCFNCIRKHRRLNLGLDENHDRDRDCSVYLSKLGLKKRRIGIAV